MLRCKACSAKDAHIEALVEQVNWLRAQLGSPTAQPALNPSDNPTEPLIPTAFLTPEMLASLHVTDAEEDVKAMLDAGQIEPEDVPEVLDALGVAGTIHFDS